VQAHVSAQKYFPTNGWGFLWIGEPERGFSVQQPGGWIYNSLPFLEEASLRELGKHEPHSSRQEIRSRLLETDLPLFSCPSRHAGLLPANLGLQLRNVEPVRYVAKTDYAINEGDWISDTDGGPPTFRHVEKDKYEWKDVTRATGISYLRSTVRASQVIDGLAHTYLVGEKYVSTSGYENSSDPGYDQSLYSGVDYDLNRWTVGPPLFDGERLEPRRYGGPHASGFFAVFCDGRVDQIPYEIDPTLHLRYGNRTDGRPLE
jgi:hypothetical protein